MLTALLILVGVALSWLVRHIDARLAEYGSDSGGPFARFWRWLWLHRWWSIRRKFYARRAQLIQWFVNRPPVARVLAHRRWEVIYWRHCMYGEDREQGGVPTAKAATSRHWTKWGAEWHRRHNPDYAGWGSFYAVTEIIERTAA